MTPNPREWWIVFGTSQSDDMRECYKRYVSAEPPDVHDREVAFRVIEHSAYAAALAEVERLRYQGADYWKTQYDELKRSIGLAELKYDENTNSATGWMVKYVRQQEENAKHSAEIERLKKIVYEEIGWQEQGGQDKQSAILSVLAEENKKLKEENERLKMCLK